MVQIQESVKTRIIYNYSYLYQASLFSFKLSQENEYGRLYYYLNSIVMISFTFEAYLNHCGENILEYWEDIDRVKTINKLNIILKTLSINLDKSKRPYQTIKDLIKIRNLLAHARTEIISHRLDRFPDSEWEKRCNKKTIKKYISDVESIIKMIHKKAFKEEEPFSVLSFGYLE